MGFTIKRTQWVKTLDDDILENNTSITNSLSILPGSNPSFHKYTELNSSCVKGLNVEKPLSFGLVQKRIFLKK